jgi:hypothetical protein
MLLLLLTSLAAPSSPASAKAPGGDEWLRSQLVTAAALPGFAITGDFAVPPDELIQGTGSYFNTVRQGSVRWARVRSFISFTIQKEIHIRLVEMTNHSFARKAIKREGTSVSLTPPLADTAAVAIRRATTDRSVAIDVFLARGRVQAQVLITVSRSRESAAFDEALKLARQVADLQFGLLLDAPDLSSNTSISLRKEQALLAAQFIWLLILIQLGAALYAAVVDRGLRERLLARLRRKPDVPQHRATQLVDLSSQARRYRIRHRFGVVARNIGFITLILVTFDTPLATQLALLAGLALFVSLAELFIARWRRRLGFRATYGMRALIAGVVTTSFTIFAIGCAAYLLFIPAMQSLAIPKALTTEDMQRISILALGLALLLLLLTDIIHRLGRRIALQGAQRILQRDQRQEILLLRSFMDDRLRIRAHRTGRQSLVERVTLRRFDGFEEIIAWALWAYGPVVAFGEPGTRLPPVGAARLSIPDRDWVSTVDQKIRASRLIVMNTGRTSAVVFEVQRIRLAGALAKTLFVFPPVAREELKRRLKILCAALDLDPGILMLEYSDGKLPLALRFDQNGVPLVSVSDRRDDFGYQAAIQLAAQSIQAAAPGPVFAPAEIASISRASVDAASAPLPISLTPAMMRKKTRRRWFAVLPWALVGLITCVSGAVTAILPDAAVSPPGRELATGAVGSIAATGSEVIFVDQDKRTLEQVWLDGRRETVYQFSAFPMRLLVDGARTYVTTRNPTAVVALERRHTKDYRLVWSAPVTDIPSGLARSGKRVFVTVPGKNVVVVLNTANGRQEAALPVGRGPWTVVEHRGKVVVGTVTDGQLVVLDPETLEASNRQAVGAPESLYTDKGDLLVCSIQDSSVTVIGDATDSPTLRIAVDRPSGPLAVTEDWIVVATYGKTPRLLIYSRQTGAIKMQYRLPTQALGVTIVSRKVVYSLPDEGVLAAVPLP